MQSSNYSEFLLRFNVSHKNDAMEPTSVLVCDNVELLMHPSNDENQHHSEALYYVLALGLPLEASRDEIFKLFEPMITEISHMLLLSTGNRIDQSEEVKVFALFAFPSESSRNLFTTLYHNLPFMQYNDCPPLMVVSIRRVIGTFPEHIHCPWLATNHRFDTSTIEKELYQLPTCSICARRIKMITTRLLLGRAGPNHLDGEDISVGRSFHYLAKGQPHSDWNISNKNSVSSGDVLTSRCRVCASFHENQTRDIFCDTSSSSSSSSSSYGGGGGLGQFCSVCNVRENNWICLICGYVGCGRYTAQHAHKHYETTRHRYSLELVSGRLWDYLQDSYVNHENTSSIYGGMIQSVHGIPSSSDYVSTSSSFGMENGNRMPSKMLGDSTESRLSLLDDGTQAKLNQTVNEYERMVEMQLQDQQLYYEKLIARETVRAMEYSFRDSMVHSSSDKVKKAIPCDNNVNEGMEEIESMKCEITSLELEYKQLQEQYKRIDEENKKYKKLNDDAAKEHKALKEKELLWITKEENMKLQASQHIKELEQQIRDLNFYVNTKKKLDASPNKQELAGGSLVTAVAPEQPVAGNKKKSKNNKSRY